MLLVTGDDAVCREATELLGDGLTTVSVKQGLGVPQRADDRAVARTRADRGRGEEALSDLKAVAPYDPGASRARSRSSTSRPSPPRKLRFQPGVEFLDDRTLVSRADDWWTAWKQFFFASD